MLCMRDRSIAMADACRKPRLPPSFTDHQPYAGWMAFLWRERFWSGNPQARQNEIFHPLRGAKYTLSPENRLKPTVKAMSDLWYFNPWSFHLAQSEAAGCIFTLPERPPFGHPLEAGVSHPSSIPAIRIIKKRYILPLFQRLNNRNTIARPCCTGGL